MRIFDRYLLRMFFKTLLVCFLSLTGLFVVVDWMANLEELLEYGEVQGGIMPAMVDYYGPVVLSFFDRISGLLAMIATMFTVAWLYRTNELTALMAGGVSKMRIVRPLIMATALISLLAVVNREAVLPQFRDKLVRKAQDLVESRGRPLNPRYDSNSMILIGGREAVPAKQQIRRPIFRLPGSLRAYGRQLTAASATYKSATPQHPAGYLMNKVRQPVDLPDIDSAYIDGQPVILTPKDASWLEDTQCFVVSNVSFEQLAHGAKWRQFSSSAELIRLLRTPSLDYRADIRVLIHARIVQPFLDVTLVLLGLPLVTTRRSRSIFVAAGMALLLVSGFFLLQITCHALGTHGYLLPSPAMAAWCPLIVLGPVAFAMAYRGWE